VKVKAWGILTSLTLVIWLVMVALPMAGSIEAAFSELSSPSSMDYGGASVTYEGVRFSMPAASDLTAPAFADLLIQAEIGQEVTFADPNLESVIREAISKPEGPIYASDLEGLGLLNASERDITNLGGLEYCTSLTRLELYVNQISDLTPLSNLDSLQELYIHNNQISDLTPLSSLTNLRTLYLGSNQISDLTPLSNLTALTDLYLFGNQISDITPLSNLTGLTDLHLSNNQVSDVTPLGNLTSLTKLSIYNNQISDIAPLGNLTSLTKLSIYNNQISDITPLVQNAGLSAGDEIDLHANPLSGESYAVLIPQLEGRGVEVLYDPNLPPSQAANIWPLYGATDVILTPVLQSSSFSDLEGNAHVASQWQITAVPRDYSSPAFDSGEDTDDLTSISVPGGTLSYSTTYYWRVRHKDSYGNWSNWSLETSFTTEEDTEKEDGETGACACASVTGGVSASELLIGWGIAGLCCGTGYCLVRRVGKRKGA